MKTKIQNYFKTFTVNVMNGGTSIVTILFLGLCLLTIDSRSSNRLISDDDSTLCLEIEGKILNANDGEDGECKVELIWNNTVLDSQLLKEGKKKFKFVLSKNEYYAIRISKKGFITRLIGVNTKMLLETEGIYKFNFNTELIGEKFAAKLNEDALDFPIAVIYFNNEEDSFDYAKEYTMAIKRQLYSGNRTYAVVKN